MKICSVAEIREMDRAAIEEFGIIEEILMENAGQGACSVLLEQTGIKDKKFCIFCGIGNNGGDGLVIARKLHSYGAEVKVFILSDPVKYKGAAKTNYKIVSQLPVPVEVIDSPDMLQSKTGIKNHINCCDIIIDAVFGTGLSRNTEGRYKDIIELINTSQKKVLSIDIPSGVNGDTGRIMGNAVRADFTITFGLPKTGNMLYPGYELGGKLYVSHISFPRSLYKSETIKTSVNTPVSLPPRNSNGHKGSFGDVLFIAGSGSYYGAPYFSACGFLKSGGGYSRLASPRSIIPFIAARCSEIVFIPQSETVSGSIAYENKNAILAQTQKRNMVVLGPGLSLEKETRQLAQELTEKIDVPLLIDGDGITALSSNLSIIQKRIPPTILTPHPGEMSSITGMSVKEIEADRIKIVQDTAEKLNAIIVLKGAHTLIAYPEGRVYINMTGNSGMGTPGSGDVLTGAVAAMFGIGLNIEDSVRMGVFIHGLSGDLAAEQYGKDGITAQDILDFLPLAVKKAREKGHELSSKTIRSIF
ncbi:Bifunctional NAD(P)H-hydrate repair enzyme [Desulfonema limicola]|uniref:Bifunctional NAD(P)H-hydrate repair enzyme n=1 Tax=Desulfonema limicola TaxID=45656 RepID=A0A975GG33_9BACT|nr:NAD(P)H-hydrate dehydratase [Desulfonema limicola]QTA79890.1 Bifunctional NAD(P)H-hydrate repair enzyme [Desulfonema limicola]